jgi:hypothetical protein
MALPGDLENRQRVESVERGRARAAAAQEEPDDRHVGRGEERLQSDAERPPRLPTRKAASATGG